MPLISYIRVSTQKQGESGLGLEAQQHAIELYAKNAGQTIACEYREIESGTHNNRPQLAKAIKHAKRIKATLCIAKLDRLARNVHFLSGLMESGCDFVACDNPSATPLTLHILAAVAEDEAKRISERVKAALAAAKRRGTLLGSARPGHWDGREQARLQGALKGAKISAEARRKASLEATSELLPIIQARREAGQTLHSIAESLNNEGHTTVRGCHWTPIGVSRVLERVS